MLSHFAPRQLVFVDETHSQGKDFRRKYGYGFRGLPAFASVYNLPHGADRSACGIAAMALEGMISVHVTDKTVDSKHFIFTLENEILPQMQPFPASCSVLVMDNAPTHDQILITNLCARFGVLVIFLPPYSYDYNPIELAFHEAKQHIRTMHGLSTTLVKEKLLEGLASVQEANIAHYFHHCGYIH